MNTSQAIAFFREHAGFSYDPQTETPDQGRDRCAAELAEAEAWAKTFGITFSWEADWEVTHTDEYPDAYDAEPETCEGCVARLDGEVLASLWCIDDASPEYRRVIEAELASEALDHIADRLVRLDQAFSASDFVLNGAS